MRHVLCARCYAEREPEREPARRVDAKPERCCCCGLVTADGIFYRDEPHAFPCKGVHEASMEERR
jgi:hypothetical protein